jgi:hypothetical protein
MTEIACGGVSALPVNRSSDVDEMLNALRSDGADRLDPVGFHYLEALYRRAQTHPEEVRRILETRLVDAVGACRQRLVQKQGEPPQPIDAVEHRSELAALVRSLAQHADAGTQALPGAKMDVPPELKSVQRSRKTWSRLSADQLFKQAVHHSPKNAGPINSHAVVLRSFALMRDMSPDYFHRFLSYVDTLLALDHDAKGVSDTKNASDSTKVRKTKPRAGRSR